MDFSDPGIVFICNVNYCNGLKSREELQMADIDNSVSNFAAKGVQRNEIIAGGGRGRPEKGGLCFVFKISSSITACPDEGEFSRTEKPNADQRGAVASQSF